MVTPVKKQVAHEPSMMTVLRDLIRAQHLRPLLLLLAALVVMTVASFGYLLVQLPRGTEIVRSASKLENYTDRISSYANEVVTHGTDESIENLEKTVADFEHGVEALRSVGGPDSNTVNSLSALMIDNAQSVLRNKDELKSLYNLRTNVGQYIPEIQESYETILKSLPPGTSTRSVLEIKDQLLYAERMQSALSQIYEGGEQTTHSAAQFQSAVMEFSRLLSGHLRGDSERWITALPKTAVISKELIQISSVFETRIRRPSLSILDTAERMRTVRDATSLIAEKAPNLVKSLGRTEFSGKNFFNRLLPTLLTILGMVGIAWVTFRLVLVRMSVDREQKELQALKIRAEYENNQNAIERILNELEGLADGDLTTNATVSEDFTGAIADCINDAIDQLRRLVEAINKTTVSVVKSSAGTQSIAMQLADASEQQSQEIAGVSAAVNEMAVSIDDVSRNAIESASVAQRSVDIAFNGGELVRRGIQGMDVIRDQIQETSKRIKRLGESSQEIGNIVSLINDIAEQTNILALNAAIQASMAGEAGRGFAVVADEVQRLAERSAFATKEIDNLVKTIQSDTNEAVISMEMTTAEVVRGARMSKDAGVALEEIQSVSKKLADLILNISNSAKQQSISASHVANTMNIIQEITSQTTSGTMETARSVGELANMAKALQNSIAGFKLPDD